MSRGSHSLRTNTVAKRGQNGGEEKAKDNLGGKEARFVTKPRSVSSDSQARWNVFCVKWGTTYDLLSNSAREQGGVIQGRKRQFLPRGIHD